MVEIDESVYLGSGRAVTYITIWNLCQISINDVPNLHRYKLVNFCSKLYSEKHKIHRSNHITNLQKSG